MTPRLCMRQYGILYVPHNYVVRRLDGVQRRIPSEFRHLGRVIIAYADRPDLSLFEWFSQRFRSFPDRCFLIVCVYLVQIHVIRIQAPQTLLILFQDLFT